jgi:hypothetical protein
MQIVVATQGPVAANTILPGTPPPPIAFVESVPSLERARSRKRDLDRHSHPETTMVIYRNHRDGRTFVLDRIHEGEPEQGGHVSYDLFQVLTGLDGQEALRLAVKIVNDFGQGGDPTIAGH